MNRDVTIPVVGVDGVSLTFSVRPLELTRDYVEFQTLLGSVDFGGDVREIVRSLWERIDASSYPSVTLENLPELIGDEGIGALASEVLAAGVDPSVIQGMRRILDIAHKATEYDPNADPACECRACKGHVEEDPRCLFAFERPLLADIFSGWDWELIRECWDLPFYVYQASVEQKRAAARGEAAQYQEAKRERENAKEAADIRRKHFGTDDWFAIAQQRGA